MLHFEKLRHPRPHGLALDVDAGQRTKHLPLGVVGESMLDCELSRLLKAMTWPRTSGRQLFHQAYEEDVPLHGRSAQRPTSSPC